MISLSSIGFIKIRFDDLFPCDELSILSFNRCLLQYYNMNKM